MSFPFYAISFTYNDQIWGRQRAINPGQQKLSFFGYAEQSRRKELRKSEMGIELESYTKTMIYYR